MFGKILSWIIDQITSVIDAISEFSSAVKEAKMRADSNKLLESKLKHLKGLQRSQQLKDKINDIESELYDDDEEEDTDDKEEESISNNPDKLFENILMKVITKNIPLAKNSDDKPALSPEVIDVIKKSKSPKELNAIAKQFFPSADEKTIETVWESFH